MTSSSLIAFCFVAPVLLLAAATAHAKDSVAWEPQHPASLDRTHPPRARTPAATAEDRWEKPFLLDGHVGAGTPLGLYGAMFEYSPIRYWAFSAGVGGNYEGPQVAGHTRLRAPLRSALALAVGAGVSHGRYKRLRPFSYAGEPSIETWANVDVQLEHRIENGYNVRAYIGRAIDTDFSTNSLTYFGVAIGRAFP